MGILASWTSQPMECLLYLTAVN